MPLSRLWRHFAEPSADVSAALADLDRLVGERPELATAGAQLAKVFRAAFGVPPTETIPPADPISLETSWREGVAAFRVWPPSLNAVVLKRRALAVCDALRADNPAAPLVHSAIRQGSVDFGSWWLEALAGRADSIGAQAEALGLDPALATSVLRLVLLPALATFSKALAPLRPEGLWSRGDCPHCGQWPVLTESRGLEQRRHLRCGLCASDWLGDRLRCPFCGETDHRALHSRYVEGEQHRYRLALCDTCGQGLKVVATLTPLTPPALLVTELATVHLDLIADHLDPAE